MNVKLPSQREARGRWLNTGPCTDSNRRSLEEMARGHASDLMHEPVNEHGGACGFLWFGEDTSLPTRSNNDGHHIDQGRV